MTLTVSLIIHVVDVIQKEGLVELVLAKTSVSLLSFPKENLRAI